MDILPDKLIFFLICTSFYLHMAEGPFQVVPIIVAVTVSAAGSLINKSIWRIGAVMAFVAASIYFKPLIFFLPLICMDLFLLQRPWFALLSVLPILYHIKSMDLLVPFQMLLLTLLAWLFARKAQVASIFREQAQRTRDDATEGNLLLQKKQKDLLEKQDYEMSVVRLKERNRIAREIHDNLGHQLSRAIIQLGALRIICKDQAAAGQIESLTATLTDGMNSIRDSIHELHEQSQSIDTEVKRLVEQFEYCPVEIEYALDGEPPQPIRNAILVIIKEALTNVIKHSQASKVKISLFEHPVFFQLIVSDNGKGASYLDRLEASGMGLSGMRERVDNLQGTIHFSSENGFRIFVNLPKG